MNKKNPFVDHPDYMPQELSPEAQARAEELIELYENAFDDAHILSLEYLTEAAELGHPKAQRYLAYVYNKIDEDAYRETEGYWYEKAARQGDPDAQNDLGHYYEFVKDDEEKALQWYQTAVERAAEAEDRFPSGVEDALDIMEGKIREGELPVDSVFRFLKYGAECGSLECMRLLTDRYGEHAPRPKHLRATPDWDHHFSIPAAERLQYLRKVAPAYVNYYYGSSLETVQAHVATMSSDVTMAEVTAESETYYDAGCVAEGEQRYRDAYEQYRKAAETGHAVAAWRLVSLCPILRKCPQEESARWYGVAMDLGHPIPNHDLFAIAAMAMEGDGEALEYLSEFYRECAKETDMESLEELAESLEAAAVAMYELWKDVRSVEHLFRLKERSDGMIARDIVEDYRALYWIQQSLYIEDIKNFVARKSEVVYAETNEEPYGLAVMAAKCIERLEKAGLDPGALCDIHYSSMRSGFQEKRSAMEERERIRREEMEEYRRRQQEKERAMAVYREKLDDRERILNSLLGNGLLTDLESTIQDKMSSSQYSTSALYREIKEAEYRRSLE